MNKHKIIANVATFPGRQEIFEYTIKSILDQVDQLNVYLNDFDEIPDFLKRENIKTVLSKNAKGDLKDNGKFYFLEECPDDAYYFTIDDDIEYPYDYVLRLVSFLESKEDAVVAGVHGIIFHSDFKSFRRTRTSFYFGHALEENMIVSALGTGTLAFKKEQLAGLTLDDFATPGMADLWLAAFCKLHRVEMISIKREAGWLKDLHGDLENEYTLWNESGKNEEMQNKIIKDNKLWELNSKGEWLWRRRLELVQVKNQQIISNLEQLYGEFNGKFRKIESSKSFRLGNLFFRSIKRPVKILTFPFNFLAILVTDSNLVYKILSIYKKTIGLAWKLNRSKKRKVLVVVNHYYGQGKDFKGKSSSQEPGVRRGIIERALKSLRNIPGAEVVVCGINGKSLMPIDKDFSHLSDPSFLVYESIEWMASQVDKYDYFINIEDDILLTKETFDRVVDFDKSNSVNECLHPNRMEKDAGKEYCVDFKAWPGWTNIEKVYKGHILKVAINPHSGLSILSKEKLKFAMNNINLKRRDKIIGHYMASAYANLNSPFLLFRASDILSWHKVIHLDNWKPKNN